MRIIHIQQGHRCDGVKLWPGDSVGWYGGETPVVETISPNPLQRAFITEYGKMTERFTRWSEEQLLYEFSVEDSTLYAQVWKGEMGLNRSTESLCEYACHEGDHSFPGILAGARRQILDGQTVQDNVDAE